MGWHSETKRDGAWHCDQAGSFIRGDPKDDDSNTDMDDFPGRDRDYYFFSLLNQVRGEFQYSFPHQDALPADASKEVREIHSSWLGDAHSTSSLTRAQLKAKLEALTLLRSEYLIRSDLEAYEHEALPHNITRLTEVITNLNEPVADEHQRIVFWFDN